MSTKIDFVLGVFNSDVNLDVSGNIESEAPVVITDVSATAIIYIPTSAVKNTFKFQTDASDVNDLSSSDIKYFVYKDEWWASADISRNPADAMLNRHSTISLYTELLNDGAENAIATMGTSSPYDDNKMFVCHDFTRYLALMLFNTHHGVDLFNNEDELLQNIRYNCSSLDPSGTLAGINNVLTAVDVNTGNLNGTLVVNGETLNYKTDEDDTNANVCRTLFLQMMSTQNGRNRFFADISNTDLPQSLPFRDGDTIQFKLTINPAADQHLLTNVSSIGARSYLIKYVLVADGEQTRVNTAVDNDELAVAAP